MKSSSLAGLFFPNSARFKKSIVEFFERINQREQHECQGARTNALSHSSAVFLKGDTLLIPILKQPPASWSWRISVNLTFCSLSSLSTSVRSWLSTPWGISRSSGLVNDWSKPEGLLEEAVSAF